MLRPMISIAMKPKMSDATPSEAKVDRSDLRVADLAQPVEMQGVPLPRPVAAVERHAGVGGRMDLGPREDILIFGHRDLLSLLSSSLQAQIGRFNHQFHHSGQPRVQNGPLMTMQIALQNAALSARKSPRRWMPSVPIE